MLSIDVISCDHSWRRRREREEGLGTRLDQDIGHILEPPLSPISLLIPSPIAEQVVVYWLVVYQNVLWKFRRVVVEKIAERFDDLGDSSGEIGVVFRQLLREGDEGIERPCLLLP
jgi:hypothetical protein